MPASFEPEALKAQAATARTYTLYKMVNGPVANHPGADVCTDITCCQAYIDPAQAAANWGDAAPLYTQKIADAVASTDGQAILYGGQPIDAVFFSSAAGSTLDAVEVWGGSVPYLTGVASPEGEEVPGYRSQVTVSLEEFKAVFLAQYPQADLSGEAAGWFQNTVPTSNGGVETVDVGGVTVKGPADPVRPALHPLCRVGGAGGDHLRRHRLRPRGGPKPIRGQRPGQAGQDLAGDRGVVLHRGDGRDLRRVVTARPGR